MKELLNVKHCKYLLSLSKAEVKALVYDADAHTKDGEKYNFDTYYGEIKKYLKDVVLHNGDMEVEYRYAPNRKSGRRYCTTFAIQRLQYKLRGFLIAPEYHDYDGINMHPQILLYLCRKYKLKSPTLEEYCNSRVEILNKHHLSKRQVLMAMNSDNFRTTNTWLKKFCSELRTIKINILNEIHCTTTNINNPISSKINFLLCEKENEIIQKVVDEHLTDETYTLMFDGLMTKQTLDINKLNETTKEYGIQWSEKPKNMEIVMPPDWMDEADVLDAKIKFSNNTYLKLKKEFEKDNFFIKDPLGYMTRLGNDFVYFQHDKFKILHQATPLLTNNDGKPIRFINKWLLDENKKTFTSLDFIPYNKELPPLNDDIFNTFMPFEYLKEYVEPNEKFIEDYVEKLVFNLCGGEVEAYEYMLKYIAFMIQYPNRKCEQCVVMMSDEEGVGKDSLTQMIENMMANESYSIKTDDPHLIFGEFNPFADKKIMIQLNEQSNKSAVEYLEKYKHITTATTIVINQKNVKAYKTHNLMRLFIASNNSKPVCVSQTDRRFVILKSTSLLVQDLKFFKEFYKGIEDKNTISGVFHYFNNIDLTDFEPKNIPMTKEKKSMVNENRPPLITFLQDFITQHEPLNVKRKDDLWVISSTEIKKKYINYHVEHGLNAVGITSQKLTRSLLKFDSITKGRARVDDGYPVQAYKIHRTKLYRHLEEKYPFEKLHDIDTSGFTEGCLIDCD